MTDDKKITKTDEIIRRATERLLSAGAEYVSPVTNNQQFENLKAMADKEAKLFRIFSLLNGGRRIG